MERRSFLLKELPEYGETCRYDINLQPYFERFLKAGSSKIPRCNSYGVFISQGHGSDQIFGGIWRDADFTLVLAKRSFWKTLFQKNYPYGALACIGFDLPEDGALIVRQIQGVRRKKKKLDSLKWERMLLQIITDFAKDNALESVSVVMAEKNRWYGASRHAQMYLHYDVTAKRSGFKFNEEQSCYIKKLNPT